MESLKLTPKPGTVDYELRGVPAPHPLLTKYLVVATAAAGVCEVMGFYPLGRDGEKVLDQVRKHLIDVWGEPRFFPGNRDPENTGLWLWSPPREPDPARFNLPKARPVETAALYRYERAGKTAVKLTFEFDNHAECERAEPQVPNPFR